MRTFKINGTEVLISPDWSISEKINARSTMNFTITDMQTLTAIETGQTVLIEDGATKLFAGSIDTLDDYEAMSGYMYYDVTAVDNNQKADKRLAAVSYTANTTGNIMSALRTTYLTDEGITTGTIQDGPTITKSQFNYDNISQAFDYIKNATGSGYFWNINYDNELDWMSRSTNNAPWVLDDDTQHENFKRQRNRNQYRNKQYVRAGTGKTSEQTNEKPSPKPDGTSKKFIVRFPIAERPTVTINSTAIATADVGVNGLDTAKKYYFSYQSNVVTQDDSEMTLSAADTIEITYIGLYPIITVADSSTEITARKAIETGTSGIYEHVQKEAEIDTSAQALEYAEGLVQKFGVIPSIVTFNTEKTGLQAGQLLTIQKSLYGINASYLIENINISSPDGIATEYSVKCLDGAALGGWEEFFKDLIKGQKEFIIQGNEVLVLLNSQTETENWAGETTISNYTVLYPADNLYPSDTLYPGTTIGSEIKND